MMFSFLVIDWAKVACCKAAGRNQGYNPADGTALRHSFFSIHLPEVGRYSKRIHELLPLSDENGPLSSTPLKEMDKMFQMAAQSRKLHYSFAYRMLPLMVFGENGMDVWHVLGDAEASGPYLLEAWERTAASQNLELFPPDGLKSKFRAGEERDLVIVYLPTPQAPPEAYYCVIQYDRTENKLHFYTVEYSVRLDGTKRVVLGKTLPGGQRHNLGALPSSDLEMALDEIERKSAHLFPFRQFE